MATFGRGVRLELKRINGTAGSGFSTVLSSPATSNYFVFINKIVYYNSSGVQILRHSLNSSGVFDTATTETLIVDNSEPWVDYLSGVQDETLSSNNFYSRLMKPGDLLQFSGNGINTYYAVWYTEVYFGGQSNY